MDITEKEYIRVQVDRIIEAIGELKKVLKEIGYYYHQEETPKEKCWCEYPEIERNNWNVSIRGPDGLPDPVWSFTFCPVCGKKL